MLILWFSVTAVLIKIIGYLLPWWFVARASGSTIDRFFVGLTFGLECVAGMGPRNCTEYGIGKSPKEIEGLVGAASMLVIQIAMPVDIGFLFIACMIIIGSSISRIYNYALMTITVVLLAFASAAYFVVLGFFIYLHLSAIKTSSVYEYTANNFPWSILIVSIGAIFLFAALVLMIVAVCRWRDYDDVSIVSYDERKIVEYPAETRYVYDNPKQYIVDRPMVHQPSTRNVVYAVDKPVQYQAVTYPSDTIYRPYTASKRY